MPLKLYRRNGIWNYRGTVGPAGKRRRLRGSCKTTNRDIAARQIAEIEDRYWKGHFDGPAAILTFAQAARMYRAAGKSPTFLDPIEKYLGQTLVKDITEGAIQLMARDLYPRASGASLNRLAIVPAQAVINHAAKSGLCSRIRIERYKIDSKIKEPVTLEWVKAFMTEAPPHLGAMALFMFLTGARPNEAGKMEWQHVDFDARTALIRESKVSKERLAHLPDTLITTLANLPRIKGRPVFICRHPHDVRTAWNSACERAGIKALTPHSCRHGFATGLLRRGVDVNTVAWLGGWASPIQVLKTYGHANKNPRLTDLLVDTPETHAVLHDEGNARKTGTS